MDIEAAHVGRPPKVAVAEYALALEDRSWNRDTAAACKPSRTKVIAKIIAAKRLRKAVPQPAGNFSTRYTRTVPVGQRVDREPPAAARLPHDVGCLGAQARARAAVPRAAGPRTARRPFVPPDRKEVIARRSPSNEPGNRLSVPPSPAAGHLEGEDRSEAETGEPVWTCRLNRPDLSKVVRRHSSTRVAEGPRHRARGPADRRRADRTQMFRQIV